MDEPIMDYVRRRLRKFGPSKWAEVAQATGCKESMLRKIAYGDRNNPGIATIQPLLTYLRECDDAPTTTPGALTAEGAR